MTLEEKLVALATKYETETFLIGDPSQFMHCCAVEEQERTAWIAAALSYGSRRQFLPKIEQLIEVYIRQKSLLPDTEERFYRLHTNKDVNRFLRTTDTIYRDYGSIKDLMIANDVHTGLGALQCLTHYFAVRHASQLVPKDTSSACKRLCMFLRWMVRDHSPVDLGLWSDIIDKSTLIIPLDTHVLHQAQQLHLLSTTAPTLAAAQQLTQRLRETFPSDPLRADYALFAEDLKA